MLIAPLIRMRGGVEPLPLPSSRPTLKAVKVIPDYEKDVDLKLAEGHAVVYLKTHPGNNLELVETFTLDKFEVKRGSAFWTFKSGSDHIIEGASQAVSLLPRLSAKLVTPIVLLPSKTGLKATYRFRIDPGYRIVTRSVFRGLIGKES